MAITITVQDIRDYAPTLTASDAAIQMLITGVTCKTEACLESAYATCPEMATLILTNAICHFAQLTGNASGEVKSRKWANGASESYSVTDSSSAGLSGTPFGEAVLQFDTAGCINAAFPAKARQFITTAGTSGSSGDYYL